MLYLNLPTLKFLSPILLTRLVNKLGKVMLLHNTACTKKDGTIMFGFPLNYQEITKNNMRTT